jgi:hypothetical protein
MIQVKAEATGDEETNFTPLVRAVRVGSCPPPRAHDFKRAKAEVLEVGR